MAASANKVLLRKDTPLGLGDIIMEVSRFNKNHYVIYKVVKLVPENDEMMIELVATKCGIYNTIGKIYYSNISAHQVHKNFIE